MLLSGWRQTNKCAPTALARAGSASVAAAGTLVLLGGRRGDAFFLDAWAVAAAAGAVECLSASAPGAAPRCYHSATLVGDEVWVVGGSDAARVVDDVWVFDLRVRAWRAPALAGDVRLLARTAHGACAHPRRPGVILLFGGYGAPRGAPRAAAAAAAAPAPAYEWRNDLVALDTRTGAVSLLSPRGAPPEPRAYHSFTAVGDRCYALFGRGPAESLVPPRAAIAVYCARDDRWVAAAHAGGEAPAPRSSHRASPVPGGVLVFGGVPAAAHKNRGRLADAHCLTETAAGGLEWAALGGGRAAAGARPARGAAAAFRSPMPWPPGRGAHAQEVIGSRLVVVTGYLDGKDYAADVWVADLALPARAGAAQAGAAPADQPPRPAAAAAAPAPASEAQEWRSTRRGGALATGLPAAAKRQRLSDVLAPPAAAAAATPPDALVAPGEHLPVHWEQRVLAAERELRELRAAQAVHQQREARLLQDKAALQGELDRRERELRETDAKWLAVSEDAARWRQLGAEAREAQAAAEGRARAALGAELKARLGDAERARAEAAAGRRAAEAELRAFQEGAAAAATREQHKAADLRKSVDDIEEALKREREQRQSLQETSALLQARVAALQADGAAGAEALQRAAAKAALERAEWDAERAALKKEAAAARAAGAEAGADAAALRRALEEAKKGERGAAAEAERYRERCHAADRECRKAVDELNCTKERYAERFAAMERASAATLRDVQAALARQVAAFGGAGGAAP
jgi:hypothetical protein